MALFSFKSGKRVKTPERPAFDPETEEAAVRCSICTGEQVAGFRSKSTGHFREIMLIRPPDDLEEFKRSCGVESCKKIF